MTLDINSPSYLVDFEASEAVVGIVGHGYVGKAVEEFFKGFVQTKIYDKFKSLSSLQDVIRYSHVIFVCVPTPMNVNDGSCHTKIVEDVLEEIRSTSVEIGRDVREFVVVLKSTVSLGFTEKMRTKLTPLRLVFSPEFLTEANSVEDFKNSNRIIIGGSVDDARVVYRFFEEVCEEKIEQNLLHILACDPTVAEMVKLFTNAFLMTKVLFSNEMYQVCQKMGVGYSEVAALSSLDERVGVSHISVPGPDGQFGAGGHCFPKDINNLRSACRELGVKERLFTAVIERNDELRAKKDWLEQVGRAVIDEKA